MGIAYPFGVPIYEFLCADCRRIYSFMVPTMTDTRTPTCPRCGGERLTREISRFAFVRGGKDPLAAQPGQEAAIFAGRPERDEGLYFLRGEDESAPRTEVRRKVPVGKPGSGDAAAPPADGNEKGGDP
jgi:putative FmdB family regulatory protein